MKIFDSFLKTPEKDTKFLGGAYSSSSSMKDAEIKTVVPIWFVHPKYGQPRNILDINNLRELSENSFASICIRTIMEEFVSAPWEIVMKDPKGNKKDVEIAEKFVSRLNMDDLKRRWVHNICLADAGILVKVFTKKSYTEGSFKVLKNSYSNVKDGNEIIKSKKILRSKDNRELVGLQAIDGFSIMKETTPSGEVKKYFQYFWNFPMANPEMFSPDEISYSSLSPRGNSVYGFSEIQTLRKVIKTLKYLESSVEISLTDSVRPTHMLIFPENTPELEIDKMSEFFQKEVRGKLHKIGMIRSSGVELLKFDYTSGEEMTLENMRMFQKICMGVFNLSIPLFSNQSNSPKAGTIELSKRETRKAIAPKLKRFDFVMTNDIFSELGGDDFNAVFQHKNYSVEEDEIKNRMYREDVLAGIITANEVREERGLPPLPERKEVEVTNSSGKKFSIREVTKK